MQRSLIDRILDIFLPKTHFEKKLEQLDALQLFEWSKLRTVSKNLLILYCFPYRRKTIKHLLYLLKFKGRSNIAKLFGPLLYEHLLLYINSNIKNPVAFAPILVPVPLPTKRIRERGYNQSSLLIDSILESDTSKYFSKQDILRCKDKIPQSQVKNKRERLKNLVDKFSVIEESVVKNRNIILVDDVVTTGATILEARKKLLDAGANRVIAICVAH